jgi:hypothetical protein
LLAILSSCLIGLTHPLHTIEQVESDKHPYFKRVWNVRHVLNEYSPLLTPQVRRTLIENDGYWPEHLNNHESIRANIRFNDCIVSFSGTANASGSTVHAQKVYDFADINVGYSFSNVLRISNGFVVVDAALLNDVQEQSGGGGEPLRKHWMESNVSGK